jgi:transposase
MITEQQYQALMKHYHTSGEVGLAAMKAGMHRETARGYLAARSGPAVLAKAHTWRTRPDPLEALWAPAEEFLRDSPEIQAKALFEYLITQHPLPQAQGALRTFQRRVRRFHEQHGAPKEVIFAQHHEPGEVLQLDWTHCDELEVTINGVAFPHLLCHGVLPYSNWEWANVCHSESSLSLKAGSQGAYWALGGVTPFLQTDQSSTATHQLKHGQAERGFNTEYLALCAHLGVSPRTIAVGCPNQNGDIEAAQGTLKRRLRNHLALRRSRDFASEAEYEVFVQQVCAGANLTRTKRLAEEVARLRPLPATRYPQTEEHALRVSSFSTVRVKQVAYSVPSRLIGARVKAYVSETEVSIRHENVEVVCSPRLSPRSQRIDFRHIIASLQRKPGAFAHYVYREELFPNVVYRQAYDRLQAANTRRGDAHYIEVLVLAAEYGVDRIGQQLCALLREGVVPSAQALKPRLADPSAPAALATLEPELDLYDELLASLLTEVGA